MTQEYENSFKNWQWSKGQRKKNLLERQNSRKVHHIIIQSKRHPLLNKILIDPPHFLLLISKNQSIELYSIVSYTCHGPWY